LKTTLIIGASENPERYSNKAAKALQNKSFPVILLGKSVGMIDGIEIKTGFPTLTIIDTVSIYLSETNQITYYDYIIKLKPKRVIFNPGTENHTFFKKLEAKNIKAENACTLVLLSLNAY
jgi:uncharacterized protein